MKTLNQLKRLLCCIGVIGLMACGDDVYYTLLNSDEKLCGKTWVEDYETEGAVTASYQLRFHKQENKGQEVTTTYTSDGRVTYDREFDWRWTDDSKETLRMTFADGKVKYLENVWVRDHYLSGRIEGKDVLLTDANYINP